MRTAAEFVLALSLFVASAQEYARIRGHVLDENNAPVPNAEVTVRYESRDLTTFSNPAGAFTLLVPKPGDYTVRVVSPGYFELRDRKVHFDVGFNDLTLVLNRIREATESLDVSAVSPNLEMDKTTSGQRLENTELNEIPFRDNSFQNSLRTLPYLKAWHERYSFRIHARVFTSVAARRTRPIMRSTVSTSPTRFRVPFRAG